MYRSTCELGGHKAATSATATTDSGDDGDSSKENSLVVDGLNNLPSNLPSTPVVSSSASSAGGGESTGRSSVGSSPWGHTLLTSRSGSSPPKQTTTTAKSSNKTIIMAATASPNTSPLSPAKPNVPWNDLCFAADVLSPGFTGRVVRAAHATTPRITREGRRQYPTAQERYVRAGVMPNVRLGGRTKAVLTPRRTPTSPLIPLSRSPSAFSTSLSSDFLSSATPRMPDIRSVASVLEPVNTSSECVRDPTSVQAVVAALQQAQAGKGVKRGSCYLEAEDLSKRQRCSTPGNSGNSVAAAAVPVNYSRDYVEENQSPGGNGSGNGNGGGEKRALDLSPTQGSPPQLSPENKRRCVLDPMHASLSSSKFLDVLRLQGSGRDTPYSMYDSRHDTDSESNRSVDSGQSKASEQSLHQQTSEATGGDSCVISPGPSERDLSDRSGSHTPQSTRGESWNSVVCGNGGTANTSRTSTPRNPTPPQHNHVITLEAYKAEKTKSQQRLKKMLGMLFHVTENEETQSSKSGSSTPVPSVAPTKHTVEIIVPSSSSSASVSTQDDKGPAGAVATPVSSKASTESTNVLSSSSEGTKNEVTTTFTFSLKPPSSASSVSEKTTKGESEEKTKEPSSTTSAEDDGNVSVSAVLKLPSASAAATDAKQSTMTFSDGSSDVAQNVTPATSVATTKPSTLVDFLKTATSPKTSSAGVADSVAPNPLLQSGGFSIPSQVSVTPATLVSEAIPSVDTATKGPSDVNLNFAAGKVSNASTNGSATAGFTLSSSAASKPGLSPFTFSLSSAPSSIASDSTSVTTSSMSGLPASPFSFVPGNAEKLASALSAATSRASVSASDSKTTSALAGAFTFGSGASISLPVNSGQNNPLVVPSLPASSTAATFSVSGGMGTAATSPSNLFTFGDAKNPVAVTGPPSSSSGQGNVNPGMMFTFGANASSTIGVNTQSAIGANLQSTIGANPQGAIGVNPQGAIGANPQGTIGASSQGTMSTPSTTTPATSGFSLGAVFGASTPSTTLSSGASIQSVITSPASSSMQPPPPYSFGQPLMSQAAITTTTTTSAFSFPSSTSQSVGAASIFQFGTTTTPSHDNKTSAGQMFPSSITSTQGSVPVSSSSSLFNFGSAGSMGTAPSSSSSLTSPFTFGAPKTDNSAPAAAAAAVAVAAAAAATTQSGYAFGSTPATTSNAFSSTTNTSAPSTGFNFGTAATPASGGFSFGTPGKAPATSTTSSPFTFGSAATKAAATFGAPTTTAAAAASPFSFGSSAAASAPTFGSATGQGFGSQTTSAPSFGTTTPSFGSGTAAAAASPFGSSAAFGATSPTPAFGSAAFGASAGSGQSGTAPNPFATQGGSLSFGTPGSTAAPAFGMPSNTPAPAAAAAAPTFGTPSSTNPAAPSFGTPSGATPAAPSFGTPSGATPAAPSFGTPASSAAAVPTFGSSAVTGAGAAFGASQTPTFGSSFGTASTSTGTNSATSPFQFGQGTANPAPPSFGMGTTTTPGGAVFQFGTAQSPFNAGNPGTGGAPRRPRNRASRRHR